MEETKNILVTLLLEGKSYDVGEMVLNKRTIYFRYQSDFLKQGINSLNFSIDKVVFFSSVIECLFEISDGT